MVPDHKKTAFASIILTLIFTYWMGTQVAESITERTQLYRIQTEVESIAHKMGGDVTTSHVRTESGRANLTLKLHPDLRDDLAALTAAHAEPADIRTGLIGPGPDGYQRVFTDITIRSEWAKSTARQWPLNPLSMTFYLAVSSVLSFLFYMMGTLIPEITADALSHPRANTVGDRR